MKSVNMRYGAAGAASIFLIGVLSEFGGGSAAARAQAPPPPPPQLVQLGRDLFFDASLSNPGGMACSTCHAPEAGFSNPISLQNENAGEVPGIVPGRFGNRIPPSAAYAALLPPGPPRQAPRARFYIGGLFWDGRAADTVQQAQAPLLNPNEMNNLVHNLPAPQLVVGKVKSGPFATLFKQVFGANVFNESTQSVYADIAQAIAAYEGSSAVCQFSSKFDAFLQNKATLTPQEFHGLQLFTGSASGRPGGPPFKNAMCAACHGMPPAGQQVAPLFTNSRFANTGVPRNPNNPYYKMTNQAADPVGYNPLGEAYIDYGLGDYLYPQEGLPSGDLAQGDPLAIDGTFKTPSLRNVDKRPYPLFVKAYAHNGFFKSLQQIVHFYNTRNLTTAPGEVIDFTRPNPYLGLKGKPLWPRPEVPSPKTLVNPRGLPPGPGHEVGNLGLTPQEEAALVAFLQTLSDGYFKP